jgi:uncharacterized protein YraI
MSQVPGCTAIFLFLALSHPAFAFTADVAAPVNLREGPGASQPIGTIEVRAAASAFDCSEQGRWCLIRGNGKLVWISPPRHDLLEVRYSLPSSDFAVSPTIIEPPVNDAQPPELGLPSSKSRHINVRAFLDRNFLAEETEYAVVEQQNCPELVVC